MACIEAVHVICHPQLSVSLSLTLNHCAVLYFVKRGRGKKKKKHTAQPSFCWLTRLNQQILSFSLILITLIGPHVSVRHSTVVLLQCRMLSREGRAVAPLSPDHAANLWRSGPLCEVAFLGCALNHSFFRSVVFFMRF